MTSASPGFSRPIDADPASIPSVVARFSVIFREFDAYSLNVYLIDLITAKLKFCNKLLPFSCKDQGARRGVRHNGQSTQATLYKRAAPGPSSVPPLSLLQFTKTSSPLTPSNSASLRRFDNMTLLLQPVFMELQSTEQTDHPSESESAAHIAQKVFSPKASEDSLYSMWKVATKVKSVMAEGERFENLTWRAWHRKNQLEKAERGRREVEIEIAREESQMRSQATAIPRLVAKPTTTYSQGYSSILLEIQRASGRAGGPNMADRPFSLDSTQTSKSTATLTATSPGAIATAESSESTTSNSSVITNRIEASRRRKKNVDKFIKRQQLHSLEKITEQTEEAKNVQLEKARNTLLEEKHIMILPKEVPVRHATAENSSVGSTNDTISVGSVGEILSRTKEEVDGHGLLRRHGQPARKHASPPHSDRPNVSMLTMLLNKSTIDAKRPESCPPPIFGTSPPCRPGAPVPSGHMDTVVDSVLNPMLDASQDLIPSPLSVTSSPNRQTGKSTSPETRLLSSEGSSTPQSANSKRRGLPTPSDYTTPLYIW